MVKHEKMYIKSDFKAVFFKPVLNGQKDKGLSAPALGLYTCINTLKYIPGPGIR